MELRVARVLHQTRAEGPFLRSAIWVQGCSIRCPGCINPHLFEAEGPPVDPAATARAIAEAGVEGLTLLGGEPFDQADACAELAEHVQNAGLGVITFTGYEHGRLSGGTRAWRRLLEATDLLVDGPYLQAEPDPVRSLIGSTNQRFVHLSNRYKSFDPAIHPNRLDVRIAPDGETRLAGFLTRPDLRDITRSQERATPS